MLKIKLLLLISVLLSGCGTHKYTTRMSNQINKHNLKGEKVVVLVDYDKSIYSTRFFIVNPKNKKILFSTTAGHGYKSGLVYATDFSNTPRSNKSSLGVYRVGRQYTGKFGRSLKLHGLSKTNSHAFLRYIVLHGQPSYRLWSLGCITVPNEDMKTVLKYLKRGTKIIVYN